MALVKCKECGQKISSKAPACPNCGSPAKAKGRSGCTTLAGLGIAIFVAAMIVVLSANRPPSTRSQSAGASTPHEVSDAEKEAERRRSAELSIVVAQRLVRQRLKDADSARFANTLAVRLPSGSTIVCGHVNARNSFGGYAGDEPFIAVGQTILFESDGKSGEFAKTWNESCTVGEVVATMR